jgi:predicted glycosyltransferase
VFSRAPRLLIYSHDSYGLGHLRRCRAIAQSLAAYREDLSVLIISGSPIVGSFSFPANVDFIRVPGVMKLGNENYQPHSPGMTIDDLMAMRSAIIAETAKVFEPDIFLVDKEPLGLRGEVEATLLLLKQMGKLLVLGLRDVMDDPARLAEEWGRKRAIPAVEDLYDRIWVYGLPQICDPLEGIGVSDEARGKARFTGYLRRAMGPSGLYAPAPVEEPYLLVTTGGGADGAVLVDWVLRAYEYDPQLDIPAKIVLGPFMGSSQQTGFMQRVARLKHVEAITFDANMELLMQKAIAVVAMGGYNTFCEILSFDKRALIVPRTSPRAEQFIRASRAAELGLTSMLLPDHSYDPAEMGKAIMALPNRRRPSKVHVPGLLDGLSVINSLVEQHLAETAPQPMQPRLAQL